MQSNKEHRAIVLGGVLMLCLTLFFLLCVGCVQTKYVPVERVQIVNTHDTLTKTDSIYRSRFVYIKGDTVHQIDTLTRWAIKERVVYVDTTSHEPQIVEVEKPTPYVPNYYRGVNVGFWLLLVVLIAAGAVKLYKIYRKWRI